MGGSQTKIQVWSSADLLHHLPSPPMGNQSTKGEDLLPDKPQNLTQLTIFLLTLENGNAHYERSSSKSKDLGARQT